MSRTCTWLALAACALVAFAQGEPEVASKEFLKKQKLIWDLFLYPNQPEFNTELYNVGRTWNIKANLDSYKRQDYVNEFLAIYEKNPLPRGEIFSIFYPEILEEAIALFKVFYYAKDFDTFYKTAAWARIYVNEGLFTYAFSVAVVHGPYTQRIRIPAHSELYPYIYFPSSVIHEAQAQKSYSALKNVPNDYVITVNASYSQFPWEKKYSLNYYTKDIAVSNLHYAAQIGHPFWMSTEEYGLPTKNRGEVFFYGLGLQQARHYMERLAHGFGKVEDFDWNHPIKFGFFPSWSYHNGVTPQPRQPNTPIPSYYYTWLRKIQEYEARISTAIDMGKYLHANGTLLSFDAEEAVNLFGNLLQGNADSVNTDFYGFYERIARNILSFSPIPVNKQNVVPSALHHYGIQQSDEVYWSLIQRIFTFYEQLVSKLPKYTYNKLVNPGVKIKSVVMDKVTTYFSSFDHSITSVVPKHSTQDKTVVKARLPQLTHKPYTVTINVQSETEGKGVVRLFISPARNEWNQKISVTEAWKYFIILDEWIVDLKVGSNKFERSSSQGRTTVHQEVNGDVFYEQILKAIAGTEPYVIPESLYGYPERMVIPKGTVEGFPLQFVVFIAPYDGEELYHNKSPIFGEKYFTKGPFSYPFDRPPYENVTDIPNLYFKEFLVYHIDESKINVTG